MIIYKSIVDEKKTRDVYILGLRIFKRWYVPGFVKRSYFWGIFKTESNKYSKKIYFLRMLIFTKSNKLSLLEDKLNQVLKVQNETVNKVQSAIMVANQHSKVFPQFKNIHKGKIGVLLGTGVTLNDYIPIPDAIHIGVNRAYLFNKVNLDYWFGLDYLNLYSYIDEVNKKDFIKFYGLAYQAFPTGFYNANAHIPSDKISSSKSYLYYFDQGNYSRVNYDIETQLLPDLYSCIFSAFSFLLYTGCKEIYIVGCDAGVTGYFNGDNQSPNTNITKVKYGWNIYKQFLEKFYPTVKIISINPIGLKGFFTDIYASEDSKSYCNDKGEKINLC